MRGRDEDPSSEGRTQPRYFVLVLHRVYGVGGLLKNHRACREWTSPIYVNVQVHAAWKALDMKARSPEKCTDASDAMVLRKTVFWPAA